MGEESPGRVAQETAELFNEFHQQSFWKRVAMLSAGALYLGTTRILLPATVIAAFVEILSYAG